MPELPPTFFPISPQVGGGTVTKLLGYCISNPLNLHEAFVYPTNIGVHTVDASVELNPEERNQHGGVQDKVNCTIIRRVTDYQTVYNSIWQCHKRQICRLLHLNGSVHMIVTMRSNVELPVNTIDKKVQAVNSSGSLCINSSVGPNPAIRVDDTSGELTVKSDWFEHEVAAREFVDAIEVRRISERKNIVGFIRNLSHKLSGTVSMKPEISPQLSYNSG